MVTFSKKICMLGDFAVGKTSLMRRFVQGIFEDKYLSTIGVKVDRKTVDIPYQGPHQGSTAKLTIMLWDLAGSEKFSQMRGNYLRGSAGAVLVCDLTRLETLANLQTYADDLWQVSPNAQIILAANKHDLIDERQITPEQIEAAAADLQASFYLTSAKTGDTVETVFLHLGQLLIG